MELFRSPEPETEEFSSLCKFGKALKKEEEEAAEAVAASPSFPEYNGPREKKGSCKKGRKEVGARTMPTEAKGDWRAAAAVVAAAVR